MENLKRKLLLFLKKQKRNAWALVLLLIPTLSFSQPVMIKEIPVNSYGFSKWNNSVTFFDKDSIWISDGTTAGTHFVKDLGEYGTIAMQGGKLLSFELPACFFFFSSNANGTSFKLWRSDGTGSGTTAIGTFNEVAPLGICNNTFLFLAKDGTNTGIYKAEVSGSSSFVKTITFAIPFGNYYNHVLSSLSPDFAQIGNTIYFSVYNAIWSPSQLWKTDGSSSGSIMLKEFNRPVSDLHNVNGTLLFLVDELDLWKSDGTVSGTVPAVNFGSDIMVSGFDDVIVYNNKLYMIQAYDGGYKHSLISTDGTETGTQIIRDNIAGYDYSIKLGVACNLIYISTFNGASESEPDMVWRSDGTNAGTFIIRDKSLFRDISSGNYLFFVDTDNESNQLWQSDLTPDNTKSVPSIFASTSFENPDYLTDVNATLFFTTAPSPYPYQHRYLWKYNPDAPTTASDFFTLVNAGNNQDKGWLHNNDTITKYTGDQIALRFNPSAAAGSIRFKLNGSVVRTENTAPYALAGDNSGVYNPWNGTQGNYTLVAEKYSGSNATGTLLGTSTINFYLKTVTLPTPPTVNAGADQNLTIPTTSTTLAASITAPAGSSITSTHWDQINGPQTATIASPSSSTTAITGMTSIGRYIFRVTAVASNGTSTSDEVSVYVNGPEISSLNLINVGNMSVISTGTITEISQAIADSINMEAVANSSTKSVRFSYDSYSHVENQVPFSLFGDINGVFTSGYFAPGTYVISVTPYTGLNATGTAGITRTTTIIVSNSLKQANTTLPAPDVKCFPNPSSDFFTISIPVNVDANGSVAIYNSKGELTETLFDGQANEGNHLELIWKSKNALPGIYYLKIKLGNQEQTQKLVLY